MFMILEPKGKNRDRLMHVWDKVVHTLECFSHKKVFAFLNFFAYRETLMILMAMP